MQVRHHLRNFSQLIYSEDGTILISCPRDFDGTVVIPKGTKGIRQNAFEDCSKITNVIVPEGVEKIGSKAFQGCLMLSKVVLPDGLSYLGKSAFSRCYNLQSVTVPASLTVLKDNTFYYNVNLQEVVIPEGVKEIGNNCFNWCRLLEKVVLPSSLCKLGTAFVDCESLSQVTIKSETVLANLDEYKSFKGCKKLKQIHKLIDVNMDICIDGIKANTSCSKFRQKYMRIKSYAFTDKKTFPEFARFNCCIPDYCLEIGHHAFYKCSIIEKVEIPGTISVIPEYAFAGCTNLKEVIIHDGVKKIEDYAFEGCSNLVNIKLPDSLISVSENAFNGCTIFDLEPKGTKVFENNRL